MISSDGCRSLLPGSRLQVLEAPLWQCNMT